MINQKELCLKLVRANTSKEVIKILDKAKLWDDHSYWEDFDRNANNFSQIGGQQSSPLNALVEKFVNQGDSILMNECLQAGINPTDYKNAPKNLKEAKEKFLNVPGGDQSLLDNAQRTTLAKKCGGICVTGDLEFPTYAIFDFGEGQHPNDFEDTFLALSRSNKIGIPFVQGKHCSGGTGSLMFSDDGLQLIISRKNPLIASKGKSDEIGWTITRKFPPVGQMKSPSFKYLKINNQIPRFNAEPLKILPKEREGDPFAKNWEHGAFIKLYSYDIGPTLRSNGCLDLIYKLSLNMISPVFPLRFYERRGVKGNSPENNMNGLQVRLKEDRGNNIDTDRFSINFSIDNQNFSGEIYLLKPGAETKRWQGGDGLMYTLNGQTNAFESSAFFARKAVKMEYLRKNLIVLIDCSDLDNDHISQLFMNNRENSRSSTFKNAVEKELETIISSHAGLKRVKEKYRNENIKSKLADNRPLQDTLNELLKKEPILSKILSGNGRLNNPINTSKNGTSGKFIGKFYPTYFDLDKSQKKFSKSKPRDVQLKRRSNFTFNTDAENDFLTRVKEPGSYNVYIDGVLTNSKPSFFGNDGIWHLNLNTPSSKAGTIHEIKIEINCINQALPFSETFYVKVVPFKKTASTLNGTKKKKGKGSSKGSSPQNLALPVCIEVKKDDHNWNRLGFSSDSALAIEKDAKGTGYDFFFNADNIILKNEMANSKEPDVIKNLFQCSLVLYGMSIASKDKEGKLDKGNPNFDLKDFTKSVTETFAPVAIPIAKNLASAHEI